VMNSRRLKVRLLSSEGVIVAVKRPTGRGHVRFGS